MKIIGILPLNFNNIPIPFKHNGTVIAPKPKPLLDGFASNPLYDKLGTKLEIEATIKTNPRIKEILDNHSIPITVNIKELENLKKEHLSNTRILTAKIYSALPENLKNDVDLQSLQEAALLHDFGKVLIPINILNKKGKLTDSERKIMELHSELGYELLKNKDLNEKTLKLIKYHHQNLKGNGYPSIEKDFNFGIEAQILNVADKYAALREKRCYKNTLGKYEALEIIANDVSNGLISQDVYTALVHAV